MPTTPKTKGNSAEDQVLKSAKWHERLAEELGSPIIPDKLSDEEKEKKYQEIDAQRERHLLYAEALRKLAKQK